MITSTKPITTPIETELITKRNTTPPKDGFNLMPFGDAEGFARYYEKMNEKLK